MAQFYGTLDNGGKQATKVGHKNVGLVTTCRGWDSGITVEASVDDSGADTFEISVNGGSNHMNRERTLLTLTAAEIAERLS